MSLADLAAVALEASPGEADLFAAIERAVPNHEHAEAGLAIARAALGALAPWPEIRRATIASCIRALREVPAPPIEPVTSTDTPALDEMLLAIARAVEKHAPAVEATREALERFLRKRP